MERSDLDVYTLRDKVVIVTGGGAGIGKGIATEMAKAGATIVITEINLERAKTAENEIKAISSNALSVVADVTRIDQVDSMVQEVLQEFGTIDVLVNNVGGLLGTIGNVPFFETSTNFWDNIVNLNLKGTFLCTKAVAKVMVDQKKKGSVVNISSICDRVPWTTVIPYGVAKAGVTNFTANMAVELGKYNIRVNAISPGRIQTPLSAELYRDKQDVRKAQLKSIPLGRFGTPDDIGRVAVFLASDAAGYVSGVTIVVSGGLTHVF